MAALRGGKKDGGGLMVRKAHFCLKGCCFQSLTCKVFLKALSLRTAPQAAKESLTVMYGLHVGAFFIVCQQ